MTPTTVRMVLVEGEKADGATVDHDVFDITAIEGSATSSAAEQVIAAVLGTKESAETGGHHLNSIGVTWSDHSEAAELRDALAARGIDDVMLVSELHAAGALAQAVGRAVGYDTTALLFIDRDTATLSVVQTDDGSVVKVLSRTLHSDDAMAVLTEMAAAVDGQDSPPQGMFVVGSGVDVSSVKAHLQNLVSIPVNAPDEPELALARGAALASAAAPPLEASTVGLAYSQDPDGTTAGSAYAGLANAATQLAPVGGAEQLVEADLVADLETPDEGRKPFLLVGSALTSIFVVGVVALVISLAVSIRPTVDQRPSPGQSAIVPSIQAPAPPPVQEAQPVVPPPAPPPPAETIKAPVPVVQEAPQAPPPPRTVYVEQPAAPAPRAPAPAPAPAAPPPAPAAPAPLPPPPVYIPPRPPVVLPPPVTLFPRPVWRPPSWNPWPQRPPQQEPEEPQWPEEPEWPKPQQPRWPQVPQQPRVTVAPQVPQLPQQEPQTPLWPRSGGSDSGDSDSGGSGRDGGSRGDGGSPIWPWPIGGGGGGGRGGD